MSPDPAQQLLLSEKQETTVNKKTKRTSKKKSNAGNQDQGLREHLVALLKGGQAHVHFMDAIEGFPEAKRGAFAEGLRHTGWQLLEHARIAQWDILEFCRSAKHVSPGFPEGYWPKTPVPPDEAAWAKSVQEFERDLQEMIKLVKSPKTDLYAAIPHGDGQTILREALLLADHNAYHLGQLVDLRRALGAWPES
jgi:DinB superfamily